MRSLSIPEMEQGHARLAWPFALASAGGAAILSSITRWWMIGPLHGPIAVAVASVCGLCIGSAISHWLRIDGTQSLRFRLSCAVLITGPFAALAVAGLCGSELLGASVLAGLALSVSILPMVWIGTWLSGRAARSRERSLVGATDRRAPLRVTAAWLSLISLGGGIVCAIPWQTRSLAGTFWWSDADRAVMAQIPWTVAWCGWLVATIIAVLDARAARVVRGVRTDLRERHGEVEADVLDLGVGEHVWIEHVGGMSSYRTVAEERVALRGDRVLAPQLLARAARRSMEMLWLATLVLLALSQMQR